MNPSPLESSSPVRRRTGLRLALITLCVVAGFGAALWSKRSATAGPAPAVSAAAATPEQILAGIPLADDGTASAKAVAAAVKKARETRDQAAVWVTLGDTLAQRLRDTAEPAYYDFAEQAYRQALRLDPRSADGMNGMAWVTGGRHVFDESMDWARQSLAIAPDNADAFGILGDAALELGDYDAAFEHYQKMMDLRPDLSSWSRGAYLLWLTGNKLKATTLMEQAIRAGGPFAENTAWCRAKLATMFMHDGAFPAAAQVLEPSLRERSRNPHVLLAAARLAVATRDYPVAEQYYRLLLELGPNLDALAGLGDLRAVQGDPVAAERFYLQVEELHASHLASGVHDHMQMAKFLADHDRNPVEALRLAEQHKLTRNVLEADVLAWVYLKNGDPPRAIEAIKRALSRHTPDAGIHYHAGMIASAAGDLEAAQRHLQTALAIDPQFDPLQAPIAAATLEGLKARRGRSAVPVGHQDAPNPPR